MNLNDVLLLGDERLYKVSSEVGRDELEKLQTPIDDLHKIVFEYREKYGAGRAIAAPQVGLMKRIICFNTTEPVTMINPELHGLSEEMIELWDDCMSFPGLLVRVLRHRKCRLTFRNPRWQECTWDLEDDLAELFQHEYDHLDGILATDRAIDKKSLKMVGQNCRP